MKIVVLFAIAAVALTTVAGPKSSSAARTACKAGTVAATIGGKHVCLAAGKACKARFAKQYRRYGFECRAGRLVRRKPSLPPPVLTPVTITLDSVGGSGVTGSATLTPLDASSTRVEIHIDNPPPGSLPAHIHLGTCAEPRGVFYTLNDVVSGSSTTTVGGIAQLQAGAFNIEVHSPEDDNPVIACGDLPQAYAAN